MLAIVGCTVCSAFDAYAALTCQQNPNTVDSGNAKNVSIRSGTIVSISLPVTGTSADEARTALSQLVEQSPLAVRAEDRKVIFLEFDTSNGRSGVGSDLGACISLSQFLTSSEMNRVRTVAYIPARRGQATLQGHAVLVAISANELAMDENASIGNAGIDEEIIKPLTKDIYSGLAAERLVLPVPVVNSMLDRSEKLFRVTVNEKVLFVDESELEKFEADLKAEKPKTLSDGNSMALLTSTQLIENRLISHQTSSRKDLARKYGVEPSSLEIDSARGKQWVAASTTLPPVIDSATVGWLKRALGNEINRGKSNMVIIEIGDCEGSENECFSLAEFIANIDSKEVRTVAYVTGDAKGAAGLIALVCDHTVFSKSGVIGTRKSPDELKPLEPKVSENYEKSARSMAKTKDRDWSIFMSMLDPKFKLDKFRNNKTGQQRLLSPAEHQSLDDANNWAVQGPVDVSDGIDAKLADELFIARTILNDRQNLNIYYQLKNEPRNLQPSKTDRWIEKLAGFFASPAVSTFLLFGTVFFLMNEASAPGTGIMGFLGGLCLLAFFWSQYLDGNVQGFEILLFVGGLVFVLIEIFLIPGFGIFGIGGLLMIVSSIILASQSFVIPLTSEELAEAPYSLLPVIGAGLGFFVGVYTLRKVLPNVPYFKNMMLNPPKRDDTGLDNRDPEAIVDWSYLAGRKGKAVTRLMPSGKAKIDGRIYDVISDGKVLNKGDELLVIEATGNRVVVGPIESSEGVKPND